MGLLRQRALTGTSSSPAYKRKGLPRDKAALQKSHWPSGVGNGASSTRLTLPKPARSTRTTSLVDWWSMAIMPTALSKAALLVLPRSDSRRDQKKGALVGRWE